jgi:hypothetical protein
MGWLSSFVDSVVDTVTDTVEYAEEIGGAIVDGDIGAIATAGGTLLGGVIGGPIGASLGNMAGNALGAAFGEGSFEDVISSGFGAIGTAVGGPIGAQVGNTLGGFLTGETDLSDLGIDDLVGVAAPIVGGAFGDDIGGFIDDIAGDALPELLGDAGTLLGGVSTVADLVGVDIDAITAPLSDIAGGTLGSALGDLAGMDGTWGEGWGSVVAEQLPDFTSIIEQVASGGDVGEIVSSIAGDQLTGFLSTLTDSGELNRVLSGLGTEGTADLINRLVGGGAEAADDGLLDGGPDDNFGQGWGDDEMQSDPEGGGEIDLDLDLVMPAAPATDGGDVFSAEVMPELPSDVATFMATDVATEAPMPGELASDAMDEVTAMDAPPAPEPMPEPAPAPEPEPTAVEVAVEVSDQMEAQTDELFSDL